jgi:ribosomal protein S18 acetylase RimI-like enzyme
MSDISIIPFSHSAHREEVILLWKTVFGYQTSHNEPSLVIDQKLAMDDGLFFVAVCDGAVVGSVMAGYDGHRGWLYSLAVLPEYRHRDIGSHLVLKAEQALTSRGCLKVNLQIVEGNEGVQAFYAALGYAVEVRVSMGKRMPISPRTDPHPRDG